MYFLATAQELPFEILANELPNFVLTKQLITIF